MADSDHFLDDIPFGPESQEWWNPGQGEHEQQHDQGKPGTGIGKSLVIVKIVGFMPLAAGKYDEAECAHAHDDVGNNVEQGAGISRALVGLQARQDTQDQEAGVGDGGIGQHTFNIGL